jgi:translation initiation factor 5B
VVVTDNEGEVIKQVEAEVKSILMSTEKEGVILRADTLGSVEAITGLLKEEGIPVRKADVGAVTKVDVMDAAAVRAKDRYLGAILAFNVEIPVDITTEAKSRSVPVLQSNVIYSLLASFNLWKEEEKAREREEALASLVFPAQIKILPGFVFRASKPAIVGIEVQSGIIRPDWELMNENGEVVGRIKSIQSEKETLQSAKTGDKIAISMDEPTVGRQINEGDILLTAVPKRHATELKEKYASQLSDSDVALLDKIQRIRRG